MPRTKINNRLWSARKAAGLTQKQVARLLGHQSISQISRWEKGWRIPPTVELLKLSAVYCRLANDLMWDLYNDLRQEINQRYNDLITEKQTSNDTDNE